MTEYKHEGLAAALVAAQAEFGTVAKDTQNPFFKSKYADLPAVMKEAQPVLAAHGLAVTQKPGFDYFIADGKVTIVDTLTTEVVHEGGERDASTMILRPVKQDPQAQGSAITYARRYAYMAVLGLVADSDDDGNAASGRARPAARKAPAAPQPSDEVKAALDRVKAAVRAAGSTPKDASTWFQSEYDESLMQSRDLEKLIAAAVHFELLAVTA